MRLPILHPQMEFFMDLNIFNGRFNKLRLLMFGHILVTVWNIRKQFSSRKMCMWVLFSSLPLKQAPLLFFWEQHNNRLDGSLDKAMAWSMGKQTSVCRESAKCNYVMVFHNIYTAHSFPDSFLVLQIHNHVENGFLEP